MSQEGKWIMLNIMKTWNFKPILGTLTFTSMWKLWIKWRIILHVRTSCKLVNNCPFLSDWQPKVYNQLGLKIKRSFYSLYSSIAEGKNQWKKRSFDAEYNNAKNDTSTRTAHRVWSVENDTGPKLCSTIIWLIFALSVGVVQILK